MKKTIFSTIIIFLATSQTYAGSTLEKIKNTQTLNIGYRENTIPFSYKDKNNTVLGYSIDVCQNIGQGIKNSLGLKTLKINYIPITSTTRFDKLNSGEIDIECGVTTNNLKRRESFAFAHTYYYASAKLLTKRKEMVNSLGDIQNKPIGVLKKTTGQDILIKRKNANMKEFDNNENAINALKNGEIVAILHDDIQLYVFEKKQPDVFKIIDYSYSVEPLAPMMSNKDKEFVNLVEKESEKIFNNKKMDVLYQKWFMSPIVEQNINLNVKPSILLKDNFLKVRKETTDKIVL